jgi:hypothetical protein
MRKEDPEDDHRERNRLAQALYRKRHAKRLANARKVANAMLRQSFCADGDIARIAEGLAETFTKAGIRDLRKALAGKGR